VEKSAHHKTPTPLVLGPINPDKGKVRITFFSHENAFESRTINVIQDHVARLHRRLAVVGGGPWLQAQSIFSTIIVDPDSQDVHCEGAMSLCKALQPFAPLDAVSVAKRLHKRLGCTGSKTSDHMNLERLDACGTCRCASATRLSEVAMKKIYY